MTNIQVIERARALRENRYSQAKQAKAFIYQEDPWNFATMMIDGDYFLNRDWDEFRRFPNLLEEWRRRTNMREVFRGPNDEVVFVGG